LREERGGKDIRVGKGGWMRYMKGKDSTEGGALGGGKSERIVEEGGKWAWGGTETLLVG